MLVMPGGCWLLAGASRARSRWGASERGKGEWERAAGGQGVLNEAMMAAWQALAGDADHLWCRLIGGAGAAAPELPTGLQCTAPRWVGAGRPETHTTGAGPDPAASECQLPSPAALFPLFHANLP